MNEDQLITKLKNDFSLPNGIGDDAATIPINETESYVITKDLLVEDKHFSLRYFDPASLAHKVLQVNLSDITAMGAQAHFALLGVAIPSTLSNDFVDHFLRKFTQNCKQHSIHLIGGDTTASPDKLFISLTVIGRSVNNRLKFRHSAQLGDIICITEPMGHAHAGLIALEKGVTGLETMKAAALRPTARIHEGLWFGGREEITAMMDVSDGLYIDLKRLCLSSKVGAEILLPSLVPSRELEKACSKLQISPMECMLVGGEDYELLITVKLDSFENVRAEFEQTFGYKFTKVGQITKGKTVKLMQGGQEIPFTYQPFSHFKE